MSLWGAESPAWLVSRGKHDKALESLRTLFKHVRSLEDKVFSVRRTAYHTIRLVKNFVKSLFTNSHVPGNSIIFVNDEL